MFSLLIFSVLQTQPAQAEDWEISADGSCKTIAGNTLFSNGGLRAIDGSAVVQCPLTREAAGETLIAVFARMKRSSANGPNPFCNITIRDSFGSSSSVGIRYAANHTSNQSVSIPLPTQYNYGYADVTCLLTNGDTLYGVRYLQYN